MKSTEPSAATRATVLPSPIAAYEPIGAKPSDARSPRLALTIQRRVGIRAEVGLDLLEGAILRLRDDGDEEDHGADGEEGVEPERPLLRDRRRQRQERVRDQEVEAPVEHRA